MYRAKSRANFHAAVSLAVTEPNSAASRLYYALYLAVIAELEERRFKPETIDPVAAEKKAAKQGSLDENTPEPWRHSIIRGTSVRHILALGGSETALLRTLWLNRVRADYHAMQVQSSEVTVTLDPARTFLDSLGVSTE
ncbi:MAG TPA: hypothetical protein VEJ63_08970 [Planctomycetota bacterium]|nr:hypothetical protein [Planctomycetota bacterium]